MTNAPAWIESTALQCAHEIVALSESWTYTQRKAAIQVIVARTLIEQVARSSEPCGEAMSWEKADTAVIDPDAFYIVQDNGEEWRDFNLGVHRGIIVQRRLSPTYVRGRPVWIAKIRRPVLVSSPVTEKTEALVKALKAALLIAKQDWEFPGAHPHRQAVLRDMETVLASVSGAKEP